jgi:hypothetical protein
MEKESIEGIIEEFFEYPDNNIFVALVRNKDTQYVYERNSYSVEKIYDTPHALQRYCELEKIYKKIYD